MHIYIIYDLFKSFRRCALFNKLTDKKNNGTTKNIEGVYFFNIISHIGKCPRVRDAYTYKTSYTLFSFQQYMVTYPELPLPPVFFSFF